jgi:ATPase family associated with various cellular activities (AAA)/AAA lid domain
MQSSIYWDETYRDATVDSSMAVKNRGCVFGTVHVLPGGYLWNCGYVERIVVEPGGRIDMYGIVEALEAQTASDVWLPSGDGTRAMEPGEEQNLPFTGPPGWGQLDSVWASCVFAINDVINAAGLQPWAKKRGGANAGAEVALTIGLAAMSITDMSDMRMWALISASMFNSNDELGLANPEMHAMWSPAECRQTINGSIKQHWMELGRPPDLFSALMVVSPARERAIFQKELYVEIWELVKTVVLRLGTATTTAEEWLANYKTILLNAIERGGGDPEGKTSSGLWIPPPRRGTRAGVKKDVGAAAAAKRRAGTYPFSSDEDPVDTALRELGSLVGLETVKKKVEGLAQQALVFKDRRERKLKTIEITRHTVMMGNPGTGKNTVAELLGRIYAGYGVLRHGQTTYALRQDLVAGYLGQTAPKMTEVFNKALGGVLFIDEAYSLVQGDDSRDMFGKEAIDTLVPLMENHRNDIIVIAAGYPRPMRKFLAANEGLEGRFGQTIVFPNYEDDELMQILENFFRAADYGLSPQAQPACRKVFGEVRKLLKDDFANARTARALCEASVERQAGRIHREMAKKRGGRKLSNARVSEILPQDIPPADELEPDRASEASGEAHDAA